MKLFMQKRFCFYITKILNICFIGIILVLLSNHHMYAQESSSSSSSSGSVNTDLENRIKEYERKLTDLKQQKNTLSSQIQEMDTQVYIKTLTIQKTEQTIT